MRSERASHPCPEEHTTGVHRWITSTWGYAYCQWCKAPLDKADES